MLFARRPLAWIAALAFLLLPGHAGAADQQSYGVAISGADRGEVEAALRASSQLVTLAGSGPIPAFALINRARDDVARVQTALDSFGYYQNSVSITVAELSPDDPELAARLDAIAPGTQAAVKIAVTMGPLYRIGKITLKGEVPPRDRDALGLKSGDPALARAVLDAGPRLVAALQEDGYALAKVDEPDAAADDKAHTIDVIYKVNAGPQVQLGEISFNGLKDVHESFVRRALLIHPGDRYRTGRIEEARQALAGLGVFSGVSVRAADHLSADGRIPLIFDMQERPQHAVTISGT